MKLTNLVTVKGYQAGRNGNMLVALDDHLSQDKVWTNGKKVQEVKMLICTAYVKSTDTEVIEMLQKHVDSKTSAYRLIVVSKRFLKLSRKQQLCLIERQNAMEKFDEKDRTCDMDDVTYANIVAITKYGKWVAYRAFGKARKEREKCEFKAGKMLHKQYKKDLKQMQRENRKAEKERKREKNRHEYGERMPEQAAPAQ